MVNRQNSINLSRKKGHTIQKRDPKKKMITYAKDGCKPQVRNFGEPPDYICTPSGYKYFLSRQEKIDYLYGGECPKLCPIQNNLGGCPDITGIADTTLAKQQCVANSNCQFISNAVIRRDGPNYCVPKKQEGCVTLTEHDLARTDKFLTDSPNFCDRLNKGCIFNRGTGDGNTSRSGPPTCLRGCLGSKYWKNPKYMWGGGGSPKDPFQGPFDFPDLQLGPLYLEAAPSARKPSGWGGPSGKPWDGHGKLPKSLGIAYTESHGRYSPPCNISEGDSGAFISAQTGEQLAGPGCTLVGPQPQYGMLDWSYVCRCPYLRDTGEFRSDAWRPCEDYQVNESIEFKRDVCKACYIQSDKNKSFYGHCVIGKEMPDTESQLLGCIRDPTKPGDSCRIQRTVGPTECPAFCSSNALDPMAWLPSTQCSTQLSNGCWEFNPAYRKIISLEQRRNNKQAPPYRPASGFSNSKCNPNDSVYEDLCENCSQTSMQTIGIGTDYPNRSYCVVGGNASFNELRDTSYGDYLARKLSCPPTCKQCLTGFFGEPLTPVYNLSEAVNPSSAFNKGIFYEPWVDSRSVQRLKEETQKFIKRESI